MKEDLTEVVKMATKIGLTEAYRRVVAAYLSCLWDHLGNLAVVI